MPCLPPRFAEKALDRCEVLYPGNKAFAFTVFDDTDNGTIWNLKPVYDLLESLGFRTTKSVWPLESDPSAPIGGLSLQDKGYHDFVKELGDGGGFEIALHNVRNTHSERPVIKHGLSVYQDLLQKPPKVHCNHAGNKDNVYWGSDRLSKGVYKTAYKIATLGKDRRFEGDKESSPFFWGDLLKENTFYVRNLVFPTINLLRINPTLPYHDPAKPYVNYWFSSSEGANIDSFCETISEENQDLLEAENGVCIMYTHFANRFVESGQVNERFESLMRRLSSKNGWFVPVGELLDYLKSQRQDSIIPKDELKAMELAWFKWKLRKGTS